MNWHSTSVTPRHPDGLSDLLLGLAVTVAAIVVVTWLSVLGGAYHLDPHHWGLMLSNAVDLERGRIPYQEVFIQYGFLSSLLAALFYKIGGTQISVLVGISVFYALGIAGTYFVSLQISAKRNLALYTFLTSLLVHPLVILPWPNYIAYPFLVFGCLCVMASADRPWLGALGGALLALAVLCREGLLLAILMPLLLLPLLDLWCSGTTRQAARRMATWGGFAIPLGLFALYLASSGLWGFWWTTAVDLPKLYTGMFFENGMLPAFERLIAYVLPVEPIQNPQRFAIGLILASVAYYCCLGLVRSEARQIGPGVLFLALLSGLLTSSALHINDLFRLATGVLVGTGLLYMLASRFKVATPLFGICAALLLAGIWSYDGNYFYPSREQQDIGTVTRQPPMFAGQRWPAEVNSYYAWYDASMRELAARDCGITYLRNETLDSYLEALSPFQQYQLAPFGVGFSPNFKPSYDAHGRVQGPRYALTSLDDWERTLRPDYDLARRLQAQDIVIVTKGALRPEDSTGTIGDQPMDSQAAVQGERTMPPGFVEFARRVAPPQPFFLAEAPVTSIWVPLRCTAEASQTPP